MVEMMTSPRSLKVTNRSDASPAPSADSVEKENVI